MDYTDVGKVVKALAFQSPETLSGAVIAGATSIPISPTIPIDWQVGVTLVLDANNPSLRESVEIMGAPVNNTVPITATQFAHVAGAPVVNATIVADYVSPASQWFDSMTYTPAGFGYESYTDTKDAYLSREGTLVVPLSKPKVKKSDVTSATYQPNVWQDPLTLDLSKAWVRDDYFLEIAAPYPFSERRGQITVNYSGGYVNLPDDLTNAVTILAARLYKIRDSGYSDVIGNNDLGVFQYKKPIPSDVETIIRRYRRWTE